MIKKEKPIRALYSFPHKLGADRICNTAWHQLDGLSKAGVEVLAFTGALQRAAPPGVTARTTLARGRVRLPYKVLGGMRTFALHDWLVARQLEGLRHKIDIVHTWPLGARRTLQEAARLGIPTVLERPNAHTAFAYEVVRRECERLGVSLPSTHEHAFNAEVLRREEEEYQLADFLLCPSDFVKQTFLERGFPVQKIIRHQYGYDPRLFFVNGGQRPQDSGLTILFVGGAAPRKGLHYALEAWLNSPASRDGKFLIAGAFVPEYEARLQPMLSHPSVCVLGHRTDVPDLMRKSDILILPSIEEGSALVTSEARACGCVLLVSDASGAICSHMENALVHTAGDVKTISEHISLLHRDRDLLSKLRESSLSTVTRISWVAAGVILLVAYERAIQTMRARR